jgi:oligopeptide transport system substrate-binding protein
VNAVGRGLLLAAVLLSACQPHDPGAPAAPILHINDALAADQTLVRALDAMPRTLDPSLLTDIPAQHVTDDLFEGLTTLAVDGTVIPGVASSWQVSADGRSWIFHLRPEARWSNGDAVVAEDFVYAWRREVDPKTAAESAPSLAPLQNALAIIAGKLPVSELGVAALDAHTLRVLLNAPTPYLLYLLSDNFMQPLHRATIERFGDDWVRPEHMVSNGPFILTDELIGNRIALQKNPRYWAADTVRLQRIVYLPFEDRSAQVTRFEAGDVQLTDSFPGAQYHWLRSRLGDQVISGPYLGIFMVGFQMSHGPFASSQALRQALSMAVDRDILTERVRDGLYLPAYTVVPPLPGYQAPEPPWAKWSAAQRHAEARRLYAQAGFSPAHPLRVELLYNTDADNRANYEALTAMWRANLGAEIQPYNEEFRVLLQDLQLHKPTLFQDSWIGDFPDPLTFLQLFESTHPQNYGQYSNPHFDALLAAAGAEPDVDKRHAELAAAEQMIDEQALCLPLYYYSSRHLLKPYVRGFQVNVQDRNLSRYLYVLEHTGS